MCDEQDNANKTDASERKAIISKPKAVKDVPKLIKLPLNKVKTIMKLDPDCTKINLDAVILLAKATEMFIELVAKETYKITASTKRKTLMKRDLDTVIDTAACLCFLEGMMD